MNDMYEYVAVVYIYVLQWVGWFDLQMRYNPVKRHLTSVCIVGMLDSIE